MRPYCLNCVIKHLGQAYVTNLEVEMGYSDHVVLVVGHLAEASEEIFGASSDLALEIRQHRMAFIEDNKYTVPYFELYRKVKKIIDEKGCGNCEKSSEDFKKKLEAKKLEASKLVDSNFVVNEKGIVV